MYKKQHTMRATKQQKKIIHTNAHSRDIKEEYVQWATGDMDKTSCNDLNFDEANAIITHFFGKKPVVATKEDTPLFWAYFNKDNNRHKYVQSLLHQLKWTKMAPNSTARWVDLERFGCWLQSDKAPVNKPLKKMDSEELSKTIKALEGILKSMYK